MFFFRNMLFKGFFIYISIFQEEEEPRDVEAEPVKEEMTEREILNWIILSVTSHAVIVLSTQSMTSPHFPLHSRKQRSQMKLPLLYQTFLSIFCLKSLTLWSLYIYKIYRKVYKLEKSHEYISWSGLRMSELNQRKLSLKYWKISVMILKQQHYLKTLYLFLPSLDLLSSACDSCPTKAPYF